MSSQKPLTPMQRLREIRDQMAAAKALYEERDRLVVAALVEGHSHRKVGTAIGHAASHVTQISTKAKAENGGEWPGFTALVNGTKAGGTPPKEKRSWGLSPEEIQERAKSALAERKER